MPTVKHPLNFQITAFVAVVNIDSRLRQGCAKKDTEKEMMIAGRANF